MNKPTPPAPALRLRLLVLIETLVPLASLAEKLADRDDDFAVPVELGDLRRAAAAADAVAVVLGEQSTTTKKGALTCTE